MRPVSETIKSVFYLLVLGFTAIFLLQHFGVLKDAGDVVSTIKYHIQGVEFSPDHGPLYLYFYLFVLATGFVVYDLIKSISFKKDSSRFKRIIVDLILLLSITVALGELLTSYQEIWWAELLSPMIVVATILSVIFLWKLRFPEAYAGTVKFFKKKESFVIPNQDE